MSPRLGWGFVLPIFLAGAAIVVMVGVLPVWLLSQLLPLHLAIVSWTAILVLYVFMSGSRGSSRWPVPRSRSGPPDDSDEEAA